MADVLDSSMKAWREAGGKPTTFYPGPDTLPKHKTGCAAKTKGWACDCGEVTYD